MFSVQLPPNTQQIQTALHSNSEKPCCASCNKGRGLSCPLSLLFVDWLGVGWKFEREDGKVTLINRMYVLVIK